jgi:hypothetical protein
VDSMANTMVSSHHELVLAESAANVMQQLSVVAGAAADSILPPPALAPGAPPPVSFLYHAYVLLVVSEAAVLAQPHAWITALGAAISALLVIWTAPRGQKPDFTTIAVDGGMDGGGLVGGLRLAGTESFPADVPDTREEAAYAHAMTVRALNILLLQTATGTKVTIVGCLRSLQTRLATVDAYQDREALRTAFRAIQHGDSGIGDLCRQLIFPLQHAVVNSDQALLGLDAGAGARADGSPGPVGAAVGRVAGALSEFARVATAHIVSAVLASSAARASTGRVQAADPTSTTAAMAVALTRADNARAVGTIVRHAMLQKWALVDKQTVHRAQSAPASAPLAMRIPLAYADIAAVVAQQIFSRMESGRLHGDGEGSPADHNGVPGATVWQAVLDFEGVLAAVDEIAQAYKAPLMRVVDPDATPELERNAMVQVPAFDTHAFLMGAASDVEAHVLKHGGDPKTESDTLLAVLAPRIRLALTGHWAGQDGDQTADYYTLVDGGCMEHSDLPVRDIAMRIAFSATTPDGMGNQLLAFQEAHRILSVVCGSARGPHATRLGLLLATAAADLLNALPCLPVDVTLNTGALFGTALPRDDVPLRELLNWIRGMIPTLLECVLQQTQLHLADCRTAAAAAGVLKKSRRLWASVPLPAAVEAVGSIRSAATSWAWHMLWRRAVAALYGVALNPQVEKAVMDEAFGIGTGTGTGPGAGAGAGGGGGGGGAGGWGRGRGSNSKL